jgi:hypothetical protein
VSTKAVVLLVCLLISSLGAIVPSFSTEPVRIYVDPPAVMDPGALFNVSVKVDNLVNIEGAEFILTWNPTLLRAVNMTEIMFHEVTPQSEWNNFWALRNEIDFGRAWYAYTWQDNYRAETQGYAPISGNYTLATISFQVLGVGNCPLQFIRSEIVLGDINAESIGHDVTDGFFSNNVPTVPSLPIEPSKVRIYVDPRRVRDESLAVNETFTVEVKMDSLTNHSGIVTSDFHLSWDSKLLMCINIAINKSWQYKEWRLIFNDWGECALESNIPRGIPPEQAVFGNLTLATITLVVKGIGSCSLLLQSCWLEEASASGVQMSYTPVDGYFSNTLNGDLNGNNVVDIFDAIIFAKSFGARWNGFSWNEVADINGDGQINILDAILLGNLFGHTR